VRREQYVGTWLPEPLLADPAPDAAARAETADTLSLALLVVLESLSPVERAVFLLHDVFDYGYGEIAEIVGKSVENCRQLAVRARRHVEERAPRFEPSREQRDDLARRFFAAVRDGETEALEELLAEDVVFYGDGGGKAPAIKAPLEGPFRVSRFVLGLGRVALRDGIPMRLAEVNGQPGLVALNPDGSVLNVMALDIVDGRIAALRSIVNPDKLAHIRL
jgi:RNA polymerase sigma-70 factor (ECF subfamily)